MNVHSGKLEKFQNHFSRYPILSHTWGEEEDEIHFGDIQKEHLLKTGPGRIKFDGCCRQAKADGFDYVWIDTCCIEKSHHTDYSEAITSMFSWYQTAGRCYAYLADVPDKATSTFDNDFRRSRWHTRGWTLQELLAPQDLIFYSKSWTKLGEKVSMTSMIEEATGIPAQFLDGFRDASVAQRMSWAARRVTTRGEDMAYCLYGIFNVSFPIMYGEGASAAFSRLQEAILQRTPDASILAWGLDLQHEDLLPEPPSTNRYGHILATSPQNFVDCGTVVPWESDLSGQRLDVNSGYYHLQLPLHTTKAGHTFGLLKCYSRSQQRGCIGIPLCKVEQGLETDEFMRPRGSKAVQLFDIDSSHEASNLRIRDLSLSEDIQRFDRRYGYSIEVPASSKLTVFDVYPKDRWDTSKKLGTTGVDFQRDAVQLSWIRLRHNEEQSPDFVVMLELEISSSQAQLKCHLMVASRSMDLDTIAVEIPALPSLSRFTGRERASNGWCNLTVNQTTKRQGGYAIYEISLTELERRQVDFVDITSEIELATWNRRLQSLFEEDLQIGPKANTVARSVLEKQAHIKYKATHLSSMKKELERLPLEVAESKKVLKSLTHQEQRLQEKKSGILQSISTLSERLPMGVGVNRLMQWHNSVAQSLSRTLPAQDADIESIPDEKTRLFMRAIAIGHLGAMEYLSGQLDDATKASTSPAALSTAIKSSNIEALIWLLERGFDVNSQDSDGLTPLGRAAPGGLISVCLLLIQRREDIGLDIDLEGSDGRSPLVLAVINDHVEVVGLLLDGKASISNMDSGADLHALTLAARYGRVEIARLLLDANAALDAEDENGETALTMAASKGHDGVLQLLIDRKANIEATSRNGSTPLTVAAHEGHVRISRLLLNHGANTNARDDDDSTPLHLAARKGHHHVVKLLLDNDADIEAKDRWGFSALAAAAYESFEQTGRLLLERKAYIESSTNDGRTPLIWTAVNGHDHMAQLLVDKGADLGAREVGGRNALEHCLYNEDLATTRVLLGRRLPIDRQDMCFDRAMNIAIAKSFSEVVRLLLREGHGKFTNDETVGFLKYAKEFATDIEDDKAEAMDEIIAMLEDAITPRERVRRYQLHRPSIWEETVQTPPDSVNFLERKNIPYSERQAHTEQSFDIPISEYSERGRTWSPDAPQQSQTSNDHNGKHDDPRWKRKAARYKKSSMNSEQRSRGYPSLQSLQGQHGDAYPPGHYNRDRGPDTLAVDGEKKRQRSSFETPREPNKYPRTC
ncbi:37s ribosomal protein rsm22 [Colletotrichum kahawae]|uniref:37s ribosomal protein rsm22 n=1 Tax=Colletotrichum kahawae TaxID=34407 RepID=A0AAE0DBU9_COLKA|nr:37s ribosomal protein rsm22 [Colletotrichum kahawae]